MRRVFRLTGVLACILGVLHADPALAEKRVALVVGNSAYRYTSELDNPKHDAADMAATLKKHGFEVIEGADLDKTAFERKVGDFAVALRGAAAGVFFYAGHGLQVAGVNYLVPIDARAEDEVRLDLEMVRVEVVHRIMERQTGSNVLFLDACRDNPLARNLARKLGTRSMEVGRGLRQVEAGAGTLISFATQPGNVALDGTGRNSPYTGALIKHLTVPKGDLNAILVNVRRDVMQATRNRQVPWENSALTDQFYFGPPPKGSDSAGSERDAAADKVEWTRATAANRLDAYRAYIKAFPIGGFVQQAHHHITALEQFAVRWDVLKVSKDLPKLRSFADDARNSEFGPLAALRFKELEALEATAWHDAATKQRLASYQSFLAAWPQGFFAVSAREKMAELETIRSEWVKIKGSEDETAIESFVFRFGWSESGAEATANLVALRRARAAPDSHDIKTLVADEMLRLIDNAAIVFRSSGEVIHFATQSMPTWRPRLGKTFLKQMLQEDLAAEGAFASKLSNVSQGRTIEGLGAIVRSKVDKTGSLFLLQLDGTERSGKDVDSKDRQFKTLQIVSDAFGYVCIATEWHSVLASTKPVRTPERCAISKKQ